MEHELNFTKSHENNLNSIENDQNTSQTCFNFSKSKMPFDTKIPQKMKKILKLIKPRESVIKLLNMLPPMPFSFYNPDAVILGPMEYNGSSYKGQMLNEEFHGKGTLVWEEGVYQGEFYYGDMHGYGRMVRDDFTVREGIWSIGKFQGVLKRIEVE